MCAENCKMLLHDAIGRPVRASEEAASLAEFYSLRAYPVRYPLSRKLQRAVLERDGFACLYCGSRDELQIDHILAVRHGGRDVLNNLQTLCKTHNQEKGTYVCDLRAITEEELLSLNDYKYAD